ncbi:MAG TPA: hypothetical protein VMT75_05765 [Candidatus Saccharimonadales bacterium]|nr:hypothetical protein [Candidatus Saccharimonadales bacterium]
MPHVVSMLALVGAPAAAVVDELALVLPPVAASAAAGHSDAKEQASVWAQVQ